MLKDIITSKKSLFLPGAHTELRAQKNRTRRVSFTQGNLMTNSRTESSGVCARVYRNGTYGFSSLAEVTPEAAETVLRAASDNASFLSSHAGRGKELFPALPAQTVPLEYDITNGEQKIYLDYLRELDAHFAAQEIPYARYSDDIIFFAEDPEALAEQRAFLLRFLAEHGLSVNPDKEASGASREGWVFLGFSWRDGVVDIAPATVQKLKDKMRRKTRALRRWQKRNEVDGERAAAAFLRVFNRKLLESPSDNDLTWSCWFFSVINTTESLHEIDRYAQDCVRCLVSGTRTKARFRVRYPELKRLGYRSLVHAYYDYDKQKGRCR